MIHWLVLKGTMELQLGHLPTCGDIVLKPSPDGIFEPFKKVPIDLI